jgi:hypothetical protein
MGTARKSGGSDTRVRGTAAPDTPRETVKAPKAHVSVQGSPEWRDWCIELAEHQRVDLAQLIDQLLTERGRAVGFREPPRRR